MDTLIDNRNFPPEMQQQPEEPKSKKRTFPRVWIFVGALLLILFLLYGFNILRFSKSTPLASDPTAPVPLTVKEQKQNLQVIKEKTPIITNEERNRKVEAFFN